MPTPAEHRAQLRQALVERDPKLFDYRLNSYVSECGCVMSLPTYIADYDELGLSEEEDSFLCGWSRPDIGAGKHWRDMTAEEAAGENGLREALRRFDLVDARARAREQE